MHSHLSLQEWIERSSRNLSSRRVLLASDEPSVFEDARKRYSQYEVFGALDHARTAAVNQRETFDSMTGVALDILALSQTDYLVCTFTSAVRIA